MVLDEWGQRWDFEGPERVQFNRYCATRTQKNAYLAYCAEFRQTHPRTAGNKIMRDWRKVLTSEDRRKQYQRIVDASELDRILNVDIHDNTVKGMPGTDEKERDLHSEWRDQIPLQSALTYRCVRVLYQSIQGTGEHKVETVVLLYVGFDNMEGRAKDRFVLKRIRTANRHEVKELRRANEILDELPDSKAILKNWLWVISKRTERDGLSQSSPMYEIRSYMDYCPCGTLQDLVDLYDTTTWKDDNQDQIPEPFVWILLRAIAKAVYLMYSGLNYRPESECVTQSERDSRQVGKPSRHRVIHRDIKPVNVFLAVPTDPYNSYPEVVLGDFDSLIELNSGKGEKAKGELGTPGFIAPENCTYASADFRKVRPGRAGSLDPLEAFKRVPLSNKTDVWGLGAVLWETFHTYLSKQTRQNKRVAVTSKVEMNRTGTTFPAEMWNMTTRPNFSAHLVRIMELCCQTLPENRLDPVQLMERIEDAFEKLPKTFGDFTGQVPERLQLRYPTDEYKLDRRWRGIKRKGRDEDEISSDEEGLEDGGSTTQSKRLTKVRRTGPSRQETQESEEDEMQDEEESPRWIHLLRGEYREEDADDDHSLSEVSEVGEGEIGFLLYERVMWNTAT